MRTIPHSRTNPQYNHEALPESLSGYEIAYEHVAALGGRRPRARDISPRVNGFWKNQSFHNYADYAMGSGFRSGIVRLRELSRIRCCAVMCAEALWWRCHRRIIADYLLAAGERVFHILGPDAVPPASLTKVAMPQPDGALAYEQNCSVNNCVEDQYMYPQTKVGFTPEQLPAAAKEQFAKPRKQTA